MHSLGGTLLSPENTTVTKMDIASYSHKKIKATYLRKALLTPPKLICWHPNVQCDGIREWGGPWEVLR